MIGNKKNGTVNFNIGDRRFSIYHKHENEKNYISTVSKRKWKCTDSLEKYTDSLGDS